MRLAGLCAAALGIAAQLLQANARDFVGLSRHLQQNAEVEESGDVIVSVVKTMQELIQALEGNANHIQVQSHIDATSDELIAADINGAEFFHLLPPQRGQTHSIVGNCTEPPTDEFLRGISGAPLAPLRDGQCLILAKDPVFAMSDSNVLLANFYVRYASASSGFAFEPPAGGGGTKLSWLVHVHGGNVWGRNMTVQGDGESEIGSLIIFPTAHAMFFNSSFTHADTAASNGVPITIRSSPTTFVKCAFSDHVSVAGGPVIYAESGASVWVQESTFTNNTSDYDFASRGGAQFFSDVDRQVELGSGVTEAARALSEADAGVKLLAWTEDFIVELEPLLKSSRVRLLPVETALKTPGGVGEYEAPEVAAVVEPGDGGDGSDDGGTSGGLIAGIVIAVVVAALVAAIVAVLCMRRRNNTKQADPASNPPPEGPPPPGYSSHPAYSSAHYASGHPGSVYVPGSYAPAPGPDSYGYAAPPASGKGGYNVATGAFGDTRAYGALPPQHPLNMHGPGVGPPDVDTVFTEDLTTNTLDGRTATSATSATSAARGRRSAAVSRGVTGDPGSPVGALPPNASLDDKLDRIHRQLDGMYAVGKPALGRFELLGSAHRRQGGQGIVQFARGVSDGLDYALKFFVSKTAFDAEGELYRDAVLGPLLPKIEGVSGNEGGEEGDAHGTPLPPFIAMEKGEALDEWSRRAKPDLFHSVAMLANIAKKLASMHGAGYVHRDLKPGNVMWLPRENRWTIIDFGCVARTGEPTGIAYSLRYAAPEIVQALEAGERKITPQPSLDAWSLGVMAYELLTGQPAFQVMVNGAADIRQQLLGEKELPWEGERADPAVLRKLRTLRRPIMACLDRDPSKRPSMQAVCEMCDDIFGTRTVKA